MDILSRDNLPLKHHSLVVSGDNWTTTFAWGVPYQTIDGQWRLIFNIAGSLSSPTRFLTLTIAGVTFAPEGNQCVHAELTKTAVGFYNADQQNADANTGELDISSPSGTDHDGELISGDVKLESKPTWLE